MIVVDASAMVEALVGRNADPDLLDALVGDVDAPHLLDVEVLSVLRGLMLAAKLEPSTADNARRDYLALNITRPEVSPFADRVWELRHQFTTYGACYLALAEALGAPLYTCDTTLTSTGHHADIQLRRHSH